MKKIAPIIILLFFVISCDITFEKDEEYWETEIVDTNFDCDIFIIKINKDSTIVTDSLGESTDLLYHIVNMDLNDFEVGDKFIMKLRKATTNETPACKSMGPYLSYPFVYLIDYEPVNNFEYGDTLELAIGESVSDYNYGYKITLDSVTDDSRCPLDVNCVWEGTAFGNFTIDYNGDSISHTSVRLGNYSLIKKNYFKFIDLLPYPVSDIEIAPEDYIAKIVIEK